MLSNLVDLLCDLILSVSPLLSLPGLHHPLAHHELLLRAVQRRKGRLELPLDPHLVHQLNGDQAARETGVCEADKSILIQEFLAMEFGSFLEGENHVFHLVKQLNGDMAP